MDSSVSRGRGSRKQATTVAPSWPRDLEREGERESTNKDELEAGERMVRLCKDLLHHVLVQLFLCTRKHRAPASAIYCARSSSERKQLTKRKNQTLRRSRLSVCMHIPEWCRGERLRAGRLF